MKCQSSLVFPGGVLFVVACILLDTTNTTSLPRPADEATQGKNSSASATTFCSMNYQPVCGSDGKTYSNKCHLENAKKSNKSLELKKEGACE